MMIFASNSNIVTDSIINTCCVNYNNETKCSDLCCIEQYIDYSISLMNNSFSKKELKINIDKKIDFKNEIFFSFNNKSLIKKTSPPILKRKINNYSYISLVKIIKSNT